MLKIYYRRSTAEAYFMKKYGIKTKLYPDLVKTTDGRIAWKIHRKGKTFLSFETNSDVEACMSTHPNYKEIKLGGDQKETAFAFEGKIYIYRAPDRKDRYISCPQEIVWSGVIEMATNELPNLFMITDCNGDIKNIVWKTDSGNMFSVFQNVVVEPHGKDIYHLIKKDDNFSFKGVKYFLHTHKGKPYICRKG